MKHIALKSALLGSAVSIGLFAAAQSAELNIPAGDLKTALGLYMSQTGVQLIVPESYVKGVRTRGVRGDLPSDEALSRLLSGTGFGVRHMSGAVAIVRDVQSGDIQPLLLAQATSAPRNAVETVTVTSSKLGGADVQSIPIAITALSQEQLTSTQTAGGPDLVKQVPNLTFTKTNFTGYSIQIRGIGTQAISVTTDPAVAVALNDQPFIRNHFFEQEFFDVGQVEVLRGPQGTLYGRNATAGVINITTAKPTDQFEAMASGELGNYHQRRFEGMINLPIVDDRLDIRVAGEWTKRQGYSFNESTGQRIDGRDLWSGRVTIGFKPVENLQAYLVWEHFSEDDDRIRSSKQLCKTAPIPDEVDGVPVSGGGNYGAKGNFLTQGCLPTSLYSSEAYQVPNGFSLGYITGLTAFGLVVDHLNPYAEVTQSHNLRVIQSALDPKYKAKNDLVELNADYALSSTLTLTSQTAFNNDFLWATEDYNRFNTSPGIFPYLGEDNGIRRQTLISQDGVFCDPQLGCSDRLVAQDLSTAKSWQLGQELRLASNFNGPLNFSLGGNYLHYETEENYYVFINSTTVLAAAPAFGLLYALPAWMPGVSDNHECLEAKGDGGFQYPVPARDAKVATCGYIDPNPIEKLNNQGHNYFLSQNPYVLNSYAIFGELNYEILDDLKLTTGLRWTEDQKHFVEIPSEFLVGGYGYPVAGALNQQWDQFTGRAVLNWTPKLSFTDQTLVYGSYSHGYKAGGANPPGAVLLTAAQGDIVNPTHPLSFKPEFVDAFELGTKNKLLDESLTFNADVFYYNYQHYQVSEIVDRTAINQNFSAHVEGAEIEATWEPAPGLRFNFGGGWEDTSIAKGAKAIDLMDRTAGNPDWIVVRPFVTQASNCILPVYVAAYMPAGVVSGCNDAYNRNLDPVTGLPYVANPTATNRDVIYPQTVPAGYIGFDPSTAPNGGTGFYKDLSGNKLPNSPPYTVSVGAQYSMPVSLDWAATLRGDFYWQANSWWRVFNDLEYDRLHGYTNLNLTLILTSQSGWQVMLYDKNVFNTTAITGAFLNSDDTGLPTNVFLTDPKLIGVRVTKNW